MHPSPRGGRRTKSAGVGGVGVWIEAAEVVREDVVGRVGEEDDSETGCISSFILFIVRIVQCQFLRCLTITLTSNIMLLFTSLETVLCLSLPPKHMCLVA